MAPSLALFIWIMRKSGKERERPRGGSGEADSRTSFCVRDGLSVTGAEHTGHGRKYSVMIRNQCCELWGQPRSTAWAGGRTVAVHLTWGSGWGGLRGILSGKSLLEYCERLMDRLNHERKWRFTFRRG